MALPLVDVEDDAVSDRVSVNDDVVLPVVDGDALRVWDPLLVALIVTVLVALPSWVTLVVLELELVMDCVFVLVVDEPLLRLSDRESDWEEDKVAVIVSGRELDMNERVFVVELLKSDEAVGDDDELPPVAESFLDMERLELLDHVLEVE